MRRWAMTHALAHTEPTGKVPAPVRRWPRTQIGELWQLDASPHRWFAGVAHTFPLLNLLDDCSRLPVGAHPYERERLPAYFASEGIAELAVANQHLAALREHRNRHEPHRELGMTAQAAWERARREKRSVLRPVPRCPWWPYVWSQRTTVRVGDDGRVSVGADRIRLEVAPRTRVILCEHPCGHHSVLAAAPDPKTKPVVLFTNRSTPP